MEYSGRSNEYLFYPFEGGITLSESVYECGENSFRGEDSELLKLISEDLFTE